MKSNNKQKWLYFLLSGIGFLLIISPIIVNFSYTPNGKIITEWSAGDLLQYLGTALTGIATIIIAWIAIKQSDNSYELEKRMKDLELNEYSPKLLVNEFIGKSMSAALYSQNISERSILKLEFKNDKGENNFFHTLAFTFKDININTSELVYIHNYHFKLEYSSKLFINEVFLDSIRFLDNDMEEIYVLNNINIDMETSLSNKQKAYLGLCFAANELPSKDNSYLNLLYKAKKLEIKLRFKIHTQTENIKEYEEIIIIRKHAEINDVDFIENLVTWTLSTSEICN